RFAATGPWFAVVVMLDSGIRPSFTGLAKIQSSASANCVACFHAFRMSNSSSAQATLRAECLDFTSSTNCFDNNAAYAHGLAQPVYVLPLQPRHFRNTKPKDSLYNAR